MRKYCFLLLLWVVTLGLVHAQPRPGRDYAVFFYVTDFQPGWPALPETKIEARGIKTELETEYGFQCELVANPTKQEMRTKIREYNARLTTKDQILYFFSMHGHYNLAGDRGYLVGQDGAVDDAYGDTWLSYDDLRTDLAPCKAIHILLALDA
ncbi:MAG: caspase family protein, partial [Saprospiraceae bacterium]